MKPTIIIRAATGRRVTIIVEQVLDTLKGGYSVKPLTKVPGGVEQVIELTEAA